MNTYQYILIAPSGKEVKGTVTADSLENAKSLVEEKSGGFKVKSVKDFIQLKDDMIVLED